MSGLAGLLAGHDAPGVWRWRSGLDVADVQHAVEQAGWTFGHVDGAYAQTRSDVLAAIGRTLAFPGYYGRNLDALADCLRDLGAQGVDQTSGVVLLWDAWEVLGHDDPRSLSALLAVLGERTEQGPPFAVLLRGDGPELDVPRLD